MIIQSLTAENLLKYLRLELTNLPSKGIIAISGCNESGKSSIGEAICFALFGRTFAMKEEDSQKLIRWGESYCSVALNFQLPDGVSYRLVRSLDRDHNHSARLSKATDPNSPPVARGEAAVTEVLRNILGYSFEAFIDSFYLAQREITTPQPQGHAIHVMAGIAPLSICSKELQDDIERDKSAIEGISRRNTEIAAQLTDLNFDNQRNHVLNTDQTDLTAREQELRTLKQSLTKTAAEYQKREPRRQRYINNLVLFQRLWTLAFLLELTGFGLWAALNLKIDHPLLAQSFAWLESLCPTIWLLYAGFIGLAIMILSWVRITNIKMRAKALYDSGKQLADIVTIIDECDLGLPKILRPNLPGGRVSSGRADVENRLKLKRQLPEGKISAVEIEEAVARDDAWIEQVLARISKRQDDLYQETKRERERRQTYEKLTNMATTLKKEEEELKKRIKLRIYAGDLLQNAMRHLSHRFNHHLRGLAGRTLPMFTDNRYQHLQIDEDFSIRAFSNEKRDFMELDEVSSGTQRQMMLALRLSLSQQLIDRVVRGSQFIFLDEPFAFFDEARTRSAIEALPCLSDDINQIWIVAQQFPESLKFAQNIQCRRDCDEYSQANIN